MMAWPTIICGALLTAIGTYGYLNAEPKPDGSPTSPTALIPAFIGGAVVICGALSFLPGLRKHVMHSAAALGVLGFLGGFAPVIRQAANGKDLNLTAPAAMCGLAMSAVCAIFVGLCVKSFIDARKARQTAAGAA